MAMCPLMSYTNQKAECSTDCALWRSNDGLNGQCGLVSPADRITDGLNELCSLIRDIKSKL